MVKMTKFRFLSHTADVLFEAYGKNLGELFVNSALALQEAQVDVKKVSPKIKQLIEIEEQNLDMALFDFLQELIYFKDAEELILSKFKIKVSRKDGFYRVHAECYGEKINAKKHDFKVDAKAITMHQFEVKKERNGWKARVIADV